MERLTKTQWLDHGLAVLAREGFTTLKADRLAKSLGVSRGSFYWHFKNLGDFHSKLLEHWKELTVNSAIAGLEQDIADAKGRLQALINLAGQDSLQLERAVRSWASSDSRVSSVVEAIDRQRLAYLKTIFSNMGLGEETAFARAHIVYQSFLGQLVLSGMLSAENRTLITKELITITLAPTTQLPS